MKILALEEVERTCGIMRLPSGHWPDDANKKIKYNGFVESLGERKMDLVARQKAILSKKIGGGRVHADCDFSGKAAQASKADVKQAVLQHQKVVNKILSEVRPRCLLDVAGGEVDGRVLQRALDVHRPRGEGSTLLNISAKPHADNVGEPEHFRAAMSILFKDVDVWQRQRPSLRQDILEWHWQMLHEGYEAKISAKDPVVFRHSGGFAHQMTFHAFIFSILGAIHKVVGEDRAAIARTIVGDFKCLSMNPIGRHTGKRIGVPAGVVAKAKAKAVAAPVVSEQGDEGDLFA